MNSADPHHRRAAKEEKCKCCGEPASLYGVVDFAKSCEDRRQKPLPLTGIAVYYHRCAACGFIFTTPFDSFTATDFAREIYNDDYVRVDPDYVEQRPQNIAALIVKLFGQARQDISILDNGSGSGRTAEILNRQGFSIHPYDPFSTTDNQVPDRRFDLVTSFEVLEHTPDPAHTCAAMEGLAEDGGLILFSTLVQPAAIDSERLGWWYIGPRNGHISIYTKRALELLWSNLGRRFASFNDDLHVAYRRVPDFAKHILKP